MKNRINIILIIILIILIVGLIFLWIKNNSLKNALINIKDSNLKTTEEMQETEIGEIENNNSTSEKITEEQAIEIVEDYRINTLQDTTNSYKFQKIEEETVEIKSTYSAVNGDYVINIKNSSIDVYAVYYALDDYSDMFIRYIDIYTGELIGFHGEGV